MIDRPAIIREALTWLRTPYHHQAMVKGVGVDCAMFPIAVYQSFGHLTGFDPRPYAPEWHLHHGEELYLENLAQHAIRVDFPQPGDIAMFKYGRTVSHGSLVITPGEGMEFIHAYIGEGVTTAQIFEKDYQSRLHSFWSIIE